LKHSRTWELFVVDLCSEDFRIKVGRKDIFKPTIGNESLHVIINNNEVRIANFVTSKDLIKSFENMVKFKYLGTKATDQNCIHEEIKRRLNWGNAC
jgi:hypothetical protein